jgi:hypothetical protein
MLPRPATVTTARTAPVIDLAAFRVAGALCTICRRRVPSERLWADTEGRVWDVCAGCGAAADGYSCEVPESGTR